MTTFIERLQVIDRLEIGPPEIERRRLTAPYRVIRNGTEASTELGYRWEQDVFNPDDPASDNLASMIAAQVALNYGLFCRQLEFRGPYDLVDRRFLAAMAENTAREIYVKKFLEPNPFLIGDAAELQIERRNT